MLFGAATGRRHNPTQARRQGLHGAASTAWPRRIFWEMDGVIPIPPRSHCGQEVDEGGETSRLAICAGKSR